MADKKPEEQLEERLRERLEALRKIFAPLAQELKPSDEPAPVFRPGTYRHDA